MTCTGCENRLQTVLGRTEGVVRADADHRTGRVRVRLRPGRGSIDEVKERIRAAGYEVV